MAIGDVWEYLHGQHRRYRVIGFHQMAATSGFYSVHILHMRRDGVTTGQGKWCPVRHGETVAIGYKLVL